MAPCWPGVGYVLMGAGIPLHIPGVLDAFAAQHAAEYKLMISGTAQGRLADIDTPMRLDPAEYAEGPLPVLSRPSFLAIVSSNTLATTMLRRASGTRQWVGDREPYGRRPQCASARQAATECRRRAGLRRARSGQYCRNCARWAFPSGWPAATETRPSCAKRWNRARPGVQVGTAICLQPGIRHARRSEEAAA